MSNFTMHYFMTQSNFYAIQPLQCQNQRKSTYHDKNSRCNKIPGVFQDFFGLTKLQKFSTFFQVSRSVGTLT